MCLSGVCFGLLRLLALKVKLKGLGRPWVCASKFKCGWFPGKGEPGNHIKIIYKEDLNFALFLTDRGLESSGCKV